MSCRPRSRTRSVGTTIRKGNGGSPTEIGARDLESRDRPRRLRARTPFAGPDAQHLLLGPEVGDQFCHQLDFTALARNDLVGQLADPRICQSGPFADEYGDRMMRDHRPHPSDVIDGPLPEHELDRRREDQSCSDENRDVQVTMRIHAPYVWQFWPEAYFSTTKLILAFTL